MDDKTKQLRAAAFEARAALWAGKLSHEKAKAICKLYVDHANEKGVEIAKRFKRKYRPISLAAFMR